VAKDSTKTGSGATRANLLSRRGLVRDDLTFKERVLDSLFRAPTTGWAILIWGLFIIACGSLASWSRQQPLVAVGRVMNDTALVRVEFQLDDREQTDQRKLLARQQTPRVLTAIPGEFKAIQASIELLPKSLASTEHFNEVDANLKQQFDLNEESFSAIRAEAPGGELSPGWERKAQRLADLIIRRPLLDAQTYQRAMQEGIDRRVELRLEDERSEISRDDLVSIDDAKQLTDATTQIARAAGFTEPALAAVVGRLTTNIKPTYIFDEAASVERQNAREKAVLTVKTLIQVGQPIYKRGDVLTQQQFDQYRRELRAFSQQPDRPKVLLRTLSVFGAVTAIALAVAGYLALFCPRVHNHPGRTAGIAALLAASLAVACVTTVLSPGLLTATAIAPTVFTVVVLVIGYDQRVALAIGTLHGVLVCIALDQPIGVYALMLTGASFAVLQLNEIRDRRGIIRMGLYAAAALALGTVMVALIDRPIVWEALTQTFVDAALAGAGGMSVGRAHARASSPTSSGPSTSRPASRSSSSAIPSSPCSASSSSVPRARTTTRSTWRASPRPRRTRSRPTRC
jgi:membrane-associated HD superfamily phosphohydrolase